MTNILTEQLIFQWDPTGKRLLVLHPDRETFPHPLAEVTNETLDTMTWAEASKFLGEFVTLLVPELRSKYAKYFASDDGSAA